MEAKLPEDLQTDLDRELKALEMARAEQGVSEDYLRFTGCLAKAHAAARAAIRASANAPVALVGRASEDERLLSPEEVGLDREILKKLVLDLEEAAGDESKENHLRKLAEASAEDPELLERVVAAASMGGDARQLKEAADRLDLPVHALLLVGRLLAAPFFMEARSRRGALPEIDMRALPGDPDDSKTERRHLRCPTCGSAPGLALLTRDNGARRLLCLLCGEAWLAGRLVCASCGSHDESGLATLCVGEEDPRWVEVCDGCRRYLKTVDENRLPDSFEVLPRTEEARTLYLDVIAEEEGYVRSAL